MISHNGKYLLEYSSGKLVICNNKLELKEYFIPVCCESVNRKGDNKKRDFDNFAKRDDNLARARMKVRQIIWCNLTPHTKFLTLTTADTCLDVKQFRRYLQTFFQSMKRHGFKLNYLGVLERQKERGLKENNEGSLHCHLVIFNDEFLPLDILNKCWSYGFTDIHILNGLKFENQENIKDVGAYVCKYITKESCDEWGSHSYFCSKGLKRPYEIRQILYKDEKGRYTLDTFNNDIINLYLNDLSNLDCCYSSIKSISLDKSKDIEQYIKYSQFNINERLG